jgi:hypothetical protein
MLKSPQLIPGEEFAEVSTHPTRLLIQADYRFLGVQRRR